MFMNTNENAEIQKSFGTIKEFILKKDRFLLSTHIHPDGDSLASVLVFAELLKHFGKYTLICINDRVPAKFDFLKNSDSIIQLKNVRAQKPFDAAIILDSSSLDRIGDVSTIFSPDTPILNMDHHPSNVMFGKWNVVQPDKSSTVEIVYQFFEFCQVPLNPAVAEYVYTGIVCDTGRFLFPNTNSGSLSLCAKMIRAGARPDVIAENLYFRTSRETMHALADSLKTLEFHLNGKVSSIYLANGHIPDKDLLDTEGFVDYLMTIEGTEVQFFMMEREPGVFKVSFRSKEYVDVNEIAQKLGGGGHKRASGCILEGTVESVKKKILDIITIVFDGRSASMN